MAANTVRITVPTHRSINNAICNCSEYLHSSNLEHVEIRIKMAISFSHMLRCGDMTICSLLEHNASCATSSVFHV
jgi:hypothetical protein